MSEAKRLNALKNTSLLDSQSEERFNRVVRLAAGALGTDIALISLIDENRQWFKARHGLEATQTPRNQAFCHHAIQQPNDVMVVLDAEKDKRFEKNPLVTGEPNISFYAGVPLVTRDGHALGTLCVIDSEPRSDFSNSDQQILKDLAATVMTEVELANQSQINADLTIINEELQHRMGNMYAHISGLVSVLGRTDVDKNQLVRRIREKITSLSQTQALLATADYKSVPLSKLMVTALGPFRTEQNAHRIKIQNHDDFEVSARGAFIFTLMLNELATNAMKHGALSRDTGVVDVTWKNGDEIIFIWNEVIPDSNIISSTREGFGTQILKKIVPLDLQGRADYDLNSSGLRYSVTVNPARLRLDITASNFALN